MLARTHSAKWSDKLVPHTIREFDGGWNVIDNDLNLQEKFSKVLTNMIRKDDGSLGIRWGTAEFITVPTDPPIPEYNFVGTVEILNMEYFQDYIVVVMTTGDIYMVNAASQYLLIWSHEEAARQVSLGAWTASTPYAVGDVIENPYDDTYAGLEGSLYPYIECVTSHTSHASDPSFDTLYWKAAFVGWAPRKVNAPFWELDVVYNVGDQVTYIPDPESPDFTENYVCVQYHTSTDANSPNDADYWLYTTPPVESMLALEFVSFDMFDDHLIICNGIDKPLRVQIRDYLYDSAVDHACRYLVDEGTGSNGNTPVAKYVRTMNNYVVMAGDVQLPGEIHISSKGTSGTYEGDPDPNDAIRVNIAKYASSSSQTITGLGRYRDQLIVGFEDILVPVTLGNYVAGATEGDPDIHDPIINDAVEAHGCVAHNSMQFLGDDLFMVDLVGVPSLARTTITDSITPNRHSELIDPAIQQTIRQLSVGTTRDKIFSVYNLIEKQYMAFIPNHENNALILREPELIIASMETNEIYVNAIDHNVLVGEYVNVTCDEGFNTITLGDINGNHEVNTVISDDVFTIKLPDTVVLDADGAIHSRETNEDNATEVFAYRTETFGYVLNHRKTGKNIRAWSLFRGWNWTCACRSLLGTIFFAKDGTIYRYGNEQNQLHEDFIACADPEEPELPNPPLVTSFDNFKAAVTDDCEGTPIYWEWELPWLMFKKRMNTKRLKYLGMDTRGTAEYDIDVFVDDLYKDPLGYLDPALSMTVEGRDSGGFGAGSQHYGGGRRMEGERLYAFPTKFKLMKLRFSGQSTKPLRIISILLALLAGSIRR